MSPGAYAGNCSSEKSTNCSGIEAVTPEQKIENLHQPHGVLLEMPPSGPGLTDVNQEPGEVLAVLVERLKLVFLDQPNKLLGFGINNRHH